MAKTTKKKNIKVTIINLIIKWKIIIFVKVFFLIII